MLLALAISFGSMAGMDLILKAREGQLLAESGEAAWEQPVVGRQGKEGQILTTGQVEAVVSYWERRRALTIHNPVKGQISMEESIKAGNKWLAEMGMDGKRGKEEAVHAMLETAILEEGTEESLEPYYSLWNVQISSGSMQAVLYINAVTGQVWDARIVFTEILPEKEPYGKLRRFVELSGLEASGAEKSWRYGDWMVTRLEIDGSGMYATMNWLSGFNGADTATADFKLRVE